MVLKTVVGQRAKERESWDGECGTHLSSLIMADPPTAETLSAAFLHILRKRPGRVMGSWRVCGVE
jgi:hypothetical protein